MITTGRVRSSHTRHRAQSLLIGTVLIAAATTISGHVVRGVVNPTLATAFVSSPSAAQDAPIKVMWSTRDTGIRVVCFNAANTSAPRADQPEWPRITSVGFELPGTLNGFSLVDPLTDEWELLENQTALIPGHGLVTLDFAIVADVNSAGLSPGSPHQPRGIPPGQQATRGSGTRFCVSGPFPDTLPNPSVPGESVDSTIELILNGVLVGFHRVQPHGPSPDLAVWDNPQRFIPLYPNVPVPPDRQPDQGRLKTGRGRSAS